MRMLLSAILFSVFALACTCSDSPTSSDDTRQTDEVLIDEVVESEGATVEGEGISIEFPDGTFDTTTRISVSTLDDTSGTWPEQLSPAYRITTTATEFNKPITVTIDLDTMINDSIRAAIGLPMYDHVNDTFAVGYDFRIIEDAGDRISVTIDPPDSGDYIAKRLRRTDNEAEALFIYVVAMALPRYILRKHGGTSIAISGPAHLNTEDRPLLRNIADFLGEAMDSLWRIGFDSTWNPLRTLYAGTPVTDIDVDVGNYPVTAPEIIGYYNGYAEGDNAPTFRIRIDAESLDHASTTVRRATCMHVCASIMMEINCAYGLWIVDTHGWLPFGLTRYLVERHAGDLPAPPLFAGNEYAPFTGLKYVAGKYAGRKPGGYAALFKYLADRYGDGFMVETMDSMRTGGDPVAGLIEALPDVPETWLPEFFSEYVSGAIYDVPPDTFIRYLDADSSFASAPDTAFRFSALYANLSARLFRVGVNRTDLDDDAAVEFTVEESGELAPGAVSVALFSYDGSRMRLIDRGEKVVIEDAADLASSNTDLVAVVINADTLQPYTKMETIELAARLTGKPPAYTYELKLRCEAVEDTGDGNPRIFDFNQISGESGEFTGDRYTSHLDTTMKVNNRTYDIIRDFEATFNADTSTVLSFEYYDSTTTSISVEVTYITGVNIPDTTSGSAIAFYHRGEDVCSLITTLERRRYDIVDGELVLDDVLTTHTCPDYSYVRLTLTRD